VLAESIKDASGEEARFELCPGILETRFYAVAGIPALACGPGLLTVSHGPKEFIKRKDLEACAVIYALTAARVLG
jgi:acetylornithine deacetylase/succinyl-diaminopimelate desuccinylase-like protein